VLSRNALHRLRCLVHCHIEVIVLLLFAFLGCKTSLADGEETYAVMARLVPCARFKFMVRDVLKQRTVSKLTECGHLLPQVLEESLEHHSFGGFVRLLV
jgi:uncharacterized membrane protein YeiH